MVLTEGKLQFTFPGEKAIKFDDTEFYRQRFNKLSGAKGVDFICDTDEFLLLLEVKDCLGNEADNRWRIAVNNKKVDTSPTSVDTEGRESFDNEVAHKVSMTIACLLGAQTFGENRPFKQEELLPYAKALEGEQIAQRNKTVFVVLLLEGDFQSGTRTKRMNMDRIQSSIEKKLKWLNCKVSVVDASTYRSSMFEVERMSGDF